MFGGRSVAELSSFDLMELRVWARSGGFIRDGEGDKGYPYVTYGQPRNGDDVGLYYLHSQGITCACSPKDSVILACLRNERHEAGFMRRVLSSELHAEEVLLTPEQRAHAAQRRREAEAHARMARDAAEIETRRRAAQLRQKPAGAMSLDDLEMP